MSSGVGGGGVGGWGGLNKKIKQKMFIIQYLQKILSYYTITMYNKKKIF